jgi:hypothetical protein
MKSVMSLMKPVSILILVLGALTPPVSAGEFYQQFLELTPTNQTRSFRMISALLIDTNNTGSKIPNSALDLESLRQNGKLSGVRLGMTMNEAVSLWGKPTGGWPAPIGCLHGLTTFFYKDAALGFEGDRLETIRIIPHASIVGGLSVFSKVDEFIRVLGKPTSRDESQLVYLSPVASLRMVFHDEKLQSIWVERTASRADHRKQAPGVPPQGGANGSQPLGAVTNQTPAAAGSRR